MREAIIEYEHGVLIERQDGEFYKFVSPGHRGVPDRLILMPIAKEHREIVQKYVYFIEFKAPGKAPKDYQEREHKRLRKLGHKVLVIDEI